MVRLIDLQRVVADWMRWKHYVERCLEWKVSGYQRCVVAYHSPKTSEGTVAK
ncbi:MAG: hypothetical protein OYH77_05205 [Pseudomonadota bacterium]|nr:hypothetical protein [Pseudomonadota bacterium]